MEELLVSGLSTGAVWGLGLGSIFVFLIFILIITRFVLAPLNLFFTLGKENRANFVMKGESFTGKVIFPSRTYYIDGEDGYKKKLLNDPEDSRRQKGFLGMFWIGIPGFYELFERRQQWSEWETGEKGSQNIKTRDEKTPHLIMVPFEYAMVAEKAEDIKGLPLTVVISVILEPLDANTPIFLNDDAYGQMQRICLNGTLEIIKERTFEELGALNKQAEGGTFTERLCKLNDAIPDRPDNKGVKEIFGYQINDAAIISIDIDAENEEEQKQLLSATTVKYRAEKDAEAAIAKAKGEKQVMILHSEGEKAQLEVKENFYKKIQFVPGAMNVEEKSKTPNLTTLVEGDAKNKKPLISVGK